MSKFNNPNHQQLINYLNSNIKSAWVGHSQLAMWLVNRYTPKIMIELGTEKGWSSMCFASEGIGILHTIDSHEGDYHAGFKISSLESVKNTYNYLLANKLIVKDNVNFIKGYFHDLKDTFKDGSADLIHIDGFHSHDAVKQDFDDYFPKLSENGIMLFHDITAFQDTVGKFFFNLPYPKTYLTNSAGIGILCRNQKIIDDINENWIKKLYIFDVKYFKHPDYQHLNIIKDFNWI